MKVSGQIGLSVVVVLVAVGGWYAYDHRDTLFGGSPAPAPGESAAAAGGARGGGGARRGGDVPVVTARAGVDTAGEQIRALGTLEAAEAVTVYPEVTGVLKTIEVVSGTTVEEGKVLFRLNADDETVAIDRATIAVDDARAALDRVERLAKSNNVSEVTVSDAQTAFRTAVIDLKSADIEYRKRIVRAPFTGVVGLIPVSVGDLVNTSTALTTIDDVSSFKISFNATERFVGKIRVGHPVSGTAIGLPGRHIRGRVKAVDSRVDPSTRVFKVEATMEEGIEGLKPGMSITVVADFAGEPQVTVPSLAIQWGRAGAFVWAVDGDTAHRLPVEIVGRRSGEVIVAGDIAPDTEVVVEGLQRMREGITVRRVGGPSAAPADNSVSSSGDGSQRGMSTSG
jgi:RND family efflux transporter MFP subunit